MNTDKDVRLNIRIDENFKYLLQEAANLESRTVTSFVVNALKQYIAQHHQHLMNSKKIETTD